MMCFSNLQRRSLTVVLVATFNPAPSGDTKARSLNCGTAMRPLERSSAPSRAEGP